MTLIEKLRLIERIDGLIRRKATGSSRDLARRIGMSKSSVYELISLMQELGAEIEYCNNSKTFYYTENKTLAIGFVDSNKYKGGSKSCILSFNIKKQSYAR